MPLVSRSVTPDDYFKRLDINRKRCAIRRKAEMRRQGLKLVRVGPKLAFWVKA